jgi:hypothetical protein
LMSHKPNKKNTHGHSKSDTPFLLLQKPRHFRCAGDFKR